jgi:hypothetical protein
LVYNLYVCVCVCVHVCVCVLLKCHAHVCFCSRQEGDVLWYIICGWYVFVCVHICRHVPPCIHTYMSACSRQDGDAAWCIIRVCMCACACMRAETYAYMHVLLAYLCGIHGPNQNHAIVCVGGRFDHASYRRRVPIFDRARVGLLVIMSTIQHRDTHEQA